MNSTELKTLVSRYIQAKDSNKPHLIPQAFIQDAQLEMILKTANIDFPSQVDGVEGIAQTLVRNFNRQFENVYTFCIEDTLQRFDDHYRCAWFVCMNDIDSQALKVGFGYYRWFFAAPESAEDKFRQLIIDIDTMSVFEPHHSKSCYRWLSKLSYPWCTIAELEIDPENVALHELAAFLSSDHGSKA